MRQMSLRGRAALPLGDASPGPIGRHRKARTARSNDATPSPVPDVLLISLGRASHLRDFQVVVTEAGPATPGPLLRFARSVRC